MTEPKPGNDNVRTDYKTARLNEMAAMWKGTSLEPHTIMLLSMLLQENGILNAERRHDCGNIYSARLGRRLKGCFAVGIMGHNIAARGTPIVAQDHGKPWKLYDYDYAMGDFEKDYPGFAFDWRIQFAEYTLRMTQCIDSGMTVNQCIQSWNPKEQGRIAKVKNHNSLVKQALASGNSSLTTL